MNVIPEFHPQSQERPVIADKFHDQAPAPVMSLKSAFVTVTVAAVIVDAVPRVDEFTSILLTVELPLIVRVPVTVIEETVKVFPFVPVPVLVSVAKIGEPVIVGEPAVRVQVP